MSTERAWFTIDEINEWADRYLARQKEKTMTEEDEEFNRIEREADMRREAIRAALKEHMEHLRKNMSEYERGVIDGMQKQAQSSVDKAVNSMVTKKPWQGLTEENLSAINQSCLTKLQAAISAEAILKEKNEM